MTPQTTSQISSYLKNRNYWVSSAYFFVYYFIMATCYPFMGIYLGDLNGLSSVEIGIVFSMLSLFALIFQPIFGYVADKLGLKKHMLWIIAIILVFFAPFFIYVFTPLLKKDVWMGAIVGGAYLGFAFQAGAPASEAYMDRLSRNDGFEYGRCRLFGAIGWAICAGIAGNLYGINPEAVFWMGSVGALILLVLVALARPAQNAVVTEVQAETKKVTMEHALRLAVNPRFWAFVVYVMGIACVYDMFDQQFGNFFNAFFPTKEEGIKMFGYVTTLGELLNAMIMFFIPVVALKIGSKNTLLIAGIIMSCRIIGSSFATEIWQVVILKCMHMFEVPFYLVGLFKYIADTFEAHFSATIYLVVCNFAKQVGNMLLAPTVGGMYMAEQGFPGYQHAYFILGCIAVCSTILSFILLSNPKKGNKNLDNMKTST